jgi:lipopolysaccharide/colanic/teichoic acid biosynthesis glycosyltransferase
MIPLSRIPLFKHNLYLDEVIRLWNFISGEKSIIGRRVRERTPPVQSLDELEKTLHQEW